MKNWYDDYSNVLGLAAWLDSECGSFRDVSAAIYFFEKPWKWSKEFEYWNKWRDSDGNPEQQEEIISEMFDNT